MPKGNKYKKFNACRPKRRANPEFKDGHLSGTERTTEIRRGLIRKDVKESSGAGVDPEAPIPLEITTTL